MLDNNGSVRSVRPDEIRSRQSHKSSATASVLDSKGEPISQQCEVKVIDGIYTVKLSCCNG